MRKVFVSVLFFLVCANMFSVSLRELLEESLINNIDIQTQKNIYQNSLLSKERTDGIYAPSLSVSGNVSMPESYNFESVPPSITAQLSYGQKITSGTSFKIDTSYQRTNSEFAYTDLTQHDVSVLFSLSQSLNPFWAQKGNLGNPDRISRYYDSLIKYYSYLNKVKTVFIKIIQNYIQYIGYQKQIEIYNNNLRIIDNQISASMILLQNGQTNQSKITELQNEKFNTEQDLYAYSLKVLSVLQILRSLCSVQLQEDDLPHSNSVFDEKEDEIYLFVSDTLNNHLNPEHESIEAQIQFERNSLILQREQGAPVLSIGIKGTWTDIADKFSKQCNTSVSVGADLTSLFSFVVGKEEQKTLNDIDLLKNLLVLYETNDKAERVNIENMLTLYREQSKELEKLITDEENNLVSYLSEYEKGEIALMDYEIQKYRVQNHKRMLECVNLDIWLNQLMLRF